MTPQPIAEKATGGGIALPIWVAFMKAAHPETPAREFPVPPDISLRLSAALASKDVQVTLVKGGDHRLSRDTDIALLIDTVARLATN